ncbi:MAG: GDP-mannose 4,6-dehydratase [Candidatus Woesearchaeota archaeon]
MVNILVTGGAGFIGSHLCEALLIKGHKVVCVDNLNDYYNPDIKRNNIAGIIGHPNFIFYQIDIMDDIKMLELFNNEKIEKVVHLAAMAGIRYSIKNPKLYYDTNVLATSNLLRLSVEFNVNKFIFGSSSSVYGNNKEIPFNESYSLSPLSPYASTKKLAEDLCKFYSDYYSLNIICLRFFTVYGPRGRPDMAVYKFVKAIMSDEEITVFGDGILSRDFTYVGDIINGIIASLDLDRKFEIINLAKGENIKVNEIISIIENHIGKKPIIISHPLNKGEANHTLADISKAKELLGFIPQVSIDDGIAKFIGWYNSNVKKNEEEKQQIK